LSTIHIVEEGEQMPAIAALHGFSNFLTIFEHPENKKLRELRNSPVTLHPGDAVFIPDRELRTEAAPTERLTRFTAARDVVFLRLRLQNFSGKPFANTFCAVGLERKDQTTPHTTDPKGIVEHEIEKPLKNAEVSVVKDLKVVVKYDVKIGSMRDQDTLEGQQARLNNLGYFAGFTKDDTVQFKWAAEEFKCDATKARVDEKTAPIIDAEKGVVDKAGKPDKAFIALLVKEHGI
jgi:N-acetylmuramoyl-L-alanine amidase